MDLGLSGKVAIVTGGSRGLGKASALALAAEGAGGPPASQFETTDVAIDPKTLDRSDPDGALGRAE